MSKKEKKEIVESYEKVFLSFREPIRETRTSARARLVWFVGIAGYALLNAKVYWEALGGRQFSGIELFWLSLPWVLSALLSVITHFIIDEVGVRDDILFTKKMAAIDLHRIDIIEAKDNPKEMLQIINDTHPDYKAIVKSVNRWAGLAEWLERCSFATLVMGFIWAVVGPLCL
jgi:hypothetical protein